MTAPQAAVPAPAVPAPAESVPAVPAPASGHQLAQVNVGRTVAPLDSPELAGFMDQLAEINALAERSPGFVWRLVDDAGADATGLHPDPDDGLLQINCSVWQSVEALREYVYRSDHLRVLARRREWFQRPDGAHQAMWWVPAGHRPSVAEAMARIALIRDHGPGPEAFTFREPHPAPDAR
ncbi:DUF3291 domain-containing protein [Kitasatospora sp. YST-16]|uniref:DUF3291 domain-containing protein n=1 Tax=unclassified Kitasatospora TaxID=2633591 RepID=UPI0009DDF8EE|nr:MULTISPECIES: DUF3291 domain-containing protein [unclassified Kitasatospora]WAL70376.1 DUF3291 domain-containing protein [Kitasatospora sp. YST-16]WNW36417.1 DUF3291 domain-containing protein [Streptomyces sp. Li-HN-5-13]